MERKCFLWITQLLRIVMIIQLGILTSATHISRVPSQILSNELSPGRYAWSSWGSWTPCSKTCGGGVAIQERQCLPRSSNDTVSTGPTLRITRQAGDCAGVGRRYHQCNTQPCPEGERDMRAVQCAAYDRRPYRGRFYTWIPYIDGDAPCMLNCRPLGQQFYASLALVADGTPCTRPGFKAICVQGSCKVVGRDTVLGVAGTRDLRCGRHLVSGLFSRPHLPLGYSYVTTVPRGACRLNVSELQSSQNYIALRISNGSYIMNGEFAVSTPGTYDAAGARFIYSRTAGVDSVFALGPVHHAIDIMILYTQPNPSIKYEYFIDPTSDDIESVTKSSYEISTSPAKHIRRHHNLDYQRPGARYLDSEEINDQGVLEENIVGTRKFVWKILSFTQCTRSCGGGIQLGKYRCVESNHGIDREVSPVHCTGSPPMGKRKRCGTAPCPPRWRAAAWSNCPKCGPASRTRNVGCVQDHSKGIIKISDQKCPLPKPQTTEVCEIRDCEDSYTELEVSHYRKNRDRDQIESFRGGPVYTMAPVTNNSVEDIGPEYSFSAAVGWLATEWSDCVGWCVGEGVQTRNVKCADPSGCAPRQPPETYRKCTSKLSCETHYGQWFTGDWSSCSSCKGKQVRGVLCIGGTGRHLRDSACKETRPVHERDCEGNCTAQWYTSEWGQCTGNCSTNTGVQRRTVWCAKQDGAASSEQECLQPAPLAEKPCEFICNDYDLPPELSIESQKLSPFETTTTSTTSLRTTTHEDNLANCEDKLQNCALAVQARLCHYNYYVQNCCYSCGR